jgi:hypothetical protein
MTPSINDLIGPDREVKEGDSFVIDPKRVHEINKKHSPLRLEGGEVFVYPGYHPGTKQSFLPIGMRRVWLESGKSGIMVKRDDNYFSEARLCKKGSKER